MTIAASATPGRHRSRQGPRLHSVWFVIGLAWLILYGACLLVAAMYVSFKAPIKPDQYGHPFSRHSRDRLSAYTMLFRSAFRARNATMSIDDVAALLSATSAKYGVDPCLVDAVAVYESGLNPNTITTTGAMGLMALQPETARQLSVIDPFDPSANVEGGTRLLRQLSGQFKGDVDRVLAAYNAGPHVVERFNDVPPFRETTEYVKHVGAIYRICKVQPLAFSVSAQPTGLSSCLSRK